MTTWRRGRVFGVDSLRDKLSVIEDSMPSIMPEVTETKLAAAGGDAQKVAAARRWRHKRGG